MARRPLVRTLKERCTGLRASLQLRRTATDDELAAYWPGGGENADHSVWGWIHCYANYVGFARRKEPQALERDRHARQQAVLDALADTPEVVTLSGADVDGGPRTVTVHPKSDVALREVHARNVWIARLLDDVQVLESHGTGATDVELIQRAWDEESYLQRCIAWIVTHPGPGLPFPERSARPEVPASFADWSSVDFYLVADAFQRVNVLRLNALDQSARSGTRPDWSVYFASLAAELGIPSATLLRDHSLASVLAAGAERARGREEAARAARDAA